MAVQASVSTGTTTPIRRRRDFLPYMLALPILIYEGIFILVPIIQQVASSFSSDVIGGGPVKWVGLDNYDRMIHDDNFWNAMRVTLIFMAATVIVSVGAGLMSALLMNQQFRGRGIARTVMTLPWAFPDIPTVLVFLWILNPNFGIMNVIAHFVVPGLIGNPKWLLDANLAMPIVVAIAAWKAFPFYGLVTLSALQAIPHEVYEAAKVDGANAFASFRYVTLPELTSTLLLLAVLACIFAFRQFTLIWLATGGGPAQLTETLVVNVYNAAFRDFDFSYGATIGVAGFLTVFAITIAFVFLQRRRDAEAMA